MVGDRIKKTVVILTNIPLSNGTGAAYSRIIEYSKGITTNKENQVYIASLNHKHHENITRLFSTQNIYMLGNYVGSEKKNFFINKFFGIKTRKQEFIQIIDIVKTLNTKIVFLLYPFFNTWYEEQYYINKIKSNGYKVFSERNERAIGIGINRSVQKGNIRRSISFFYSLLENINAIKQDQLVAKYDGNIVISKSFEEWIVKRNNNFIRIPILANPSNYFLNQQPTSDDTFNIVYTGSISFKKDGLGLLIHAINIVINKYGLKNLKLDFYGFGNKTEINNLKELINKYKLNSYVNFHGIINKDEVVRVLSKANLAVLIRESNLQSEFGFSTKLAEYLFSKTPILLTNVSDNSSYLINNKSAFFTDPKPLEIAKSIFYIYNLPKTKRVKIANNGYNVALNYFQIQRYAKSLGDFLG